MYPRDHDPVELPSPDVPRLLSRAEAAALLSTTPRHVERLIEDGRLGHTRVGRFIRVSMADIVEYLRRRHVEARRHQQQR